MKDCERQMPVVMWTWIRDQGGQLKNLVLKGSWSIPLEAMALWPITTIHTLTLDPFDYQTESFLSLIKAPNLILRDTRGHSSPLLSYHPSADDDHLQDIQIFVQRRFYDDRKIDHLYDFTQVPSANITVTLEGDSRYDDNYLETWKTVRTAVRKVFVDDLTQFDVSRQGHNRTAAVVQWKNEQGWKPQNQVHLQGEETDDAEQRQINHVKFYDDILRRARVRYRD
ncbi:hypothetical protein DFH11DRAFT_1049874 [Phellopilus nigrolimitatus]|nr:hypothetical protein DFH11DRAFT_1049874 [Phellopilus nigrolimitatus]